MRLETVMNRNVETVSPREPAEDAWRRMRGSRIRHLVVVDGGRVAGVVSDRDLGGSHGAAVRGQRTVAELMTPQLVSAKPTTTVRQAANLLRGHVVGCLPVFDGGKLAGIVTVSDLLDLIGRGAERPVPKSKRWTLKHRGPRYRPVRLR